MLCYTSACIGHKQVDRIIGHALQHIGLRIMWKTRFMLTHRWMHCSTLGLGTTLKVSIMRSGYSSRILLISSVPMPLPVPPPSEWHTWKPACTKEWGRPSVPLVKDCYNQGGTRGPDKGESITIIELGRTIAAPVHGRC